MNKVNIAVCQMLVTREKEKNLKKAEEMVRKAVKVNKAEIVVLPEIFNCPYSHKDMQMTAEDYPGETTAMLSDLSKNLEIYLVGGSIPEKSEGKVYNTSFIFNPEGALIGRHRKIHLYDVNIEGGITFKESDIVGYGNELTVIDTPFCKIGVAICYDMRFPELIRLMTLKGARIIIVPAAFNTTTGPAHWESIIRTRAVDNQVFFAAASPARNLDSSYHAYGHSMIVDPWGKILTEADENEAIVSAEIDLSLVEKIRNEFPLLKHRRTDLYG